MSTEDLIRSRSDRGTVLVTGGTGFLGSHCVARLIREGHPTRVTVRAPGQEAEVRATLRQAGVDPEDRLEFAVADLAADHGWADAMDGVSHVLHHASPFPFTPPEREEDVILPARDGTLRVLSAARGAGVPRVVMTSSYAAVGYTPKPGNRYAEDDWTDPDTEGLPAYHRSKVLAERAAWDYARTHTDIELAVVNPTGIFGPQLGARPNASVGLVEAMLTGRRWCRSCTSVSSTYGTSWICTCGPCCTPTRPESASSRSEGPRSASSAWPGSCGSTSPPQPICCPPGS
ncbi:NAD-dependent epimerase/dehydratase family protein [Streptomyces nigra]